MATTSKSVVQEVAPASSREALIAGVILVVALVTALVAAHVKVDLLLPLGMILMTALAFANGANDVSKAIATLAGSGVTDYRRAIIWGGICTTLGSLCSAFLATALIGTFTTGFITRGVQQTEIFALAVLVGSILWVLLATRIAMPVSTTHAITGALVCVGAVVFGANHVQWANLVQKVGLPLLLSPFVALGIAYALTYLVLPLARRNERAMNNLHWLSSGATGFSRGLNDSPKMVALGVAFFLITGHNAKFHAPFWLFALVALGIGAGSIIAGLAVTRTLAEKVTRMSHSEGFAANLTTAILVAGASNLGVPVSTTHVSSGAIIGIGLREGTRRIQWRVVRDMVLAWLVTLPAAGAIGICAYYLLRFVHGG